MMVTVPLSAMLRKPLNLYQALAELAGAIVAVGLWQELSHSKPNSMPPPASTVDFKKERLPLAVFTVVMVERFEGT
jgi:hypothetical protein